MQFTVEYRDGVFLFSISAPDTDPNYLEEFEIEDPEQAKDTVEDLIDEIMDVAEGDDEEDDGQGDLFAGMGR